MTEHQKQVLEPVIMAEKNRRLPKVALAIFLAYRKVCKNILLISIIV